MRFLHWKQDEVGCESGLKCLLWPWWGVGVGEKRREPGRSHYVEEEERREGARVPVCVCVCALVCAHVCVVCLHVPDVTSLEAPSSVLSAQTT